MKDKVERIYNHFGDKAQIAKAIEEASEYIRALTKDNKAEVLDEMADLFVTAEQMKIKYNITKNELINRIEEKLDRTIKLYNVK